MKTSIETVKDVKFIGENLYIVRKKIMNKTQEEFAEMIGVSKDTVSKIERGAALPSVKCIAVISSVTNRSIDFFLTARRS